MPSVKGMLGASPCAARLYVAAADDALYQSARSTSQGLSSTPRVSLTMGLGRMTVVPSGTCRGTPCQSHSSAGMRRRMVVAA